MRAFLFAAVTLVAGVAFAGEPAFERVDLVSDGTAVFQVPGAPTGEMFYGGDAFFVADKSMPLGRGISDSVRRCGRRGRG